VKNRLRPVLVVEDSDDDFETVLDAARRAGVLNEIRRAGSGDAAVAQLLDCLAAGQQLPALVLLDLNTPQGDGRDALQQMRGHPRLAVMPVVVLSTSSNPRDVDFCFARGVNAFHVKPVQYPAHLALLEQIFVYWLTLAVLPE
jgi:two-component system, response regulator